MESPLPKGRHLETPPQNSNRGLYFNKFFGNWARDFEKIEAGAKQEWLKTLAGDLEVDSAVSAKRIADIADALNGRAEIFETTGPFITGMGLSHPVENGFLWHHTLGVPYLPGSSIKGMIRAWVEHWCQENDELAGEIGRLFGRGPKHEDGPAAGNLIVFDALPVKPVSLYVEIITPHDGGWRISKDPANNPPADWISPNPIPFLAVKEGAAFQFALAPRPGAGEDDLGTALAYLKCALEWIGAGAKTAVGFGRFVRAADKPLGKGARVEVSNDHPLEKLRGRTGTISVPYPQQGSANVKLDGGGKGSSPVVELMYLLRLEESTSRK